MKLTSILGIVISEMLGYGIGLMATFAIVLKQSKTGYRKSELHDTTRHILWQAWEYAIEPAR